MAQLAFTIAKGLSVVIGGSAAGAIVGFVARLAPVLLLNVITSKLFAPKIPDSLASLKGTSVMVRSSVEYRKIVYGEAIVSGPVIYQNTEGTNREYLWFVLALCEGEIEDFVSVWMDGDEILKSEINWSAGAAGADGSGNGNVSTTEFIGDNSTNAMRAFYTLGHSDQVVLGPVDTAFTEWTSSHRARGTAILAVALLYDANTEKVWQTGAPNNIRAVVKGRKIYDPRLDSTQIIDSTTSPVTYGSGLHRTSDESTWEWSDNPALCAADYMLNFMPAISATSINWESIANAADDCDVQVVVPPVASPSNTETRFTCNGVVSLGASHQDNLNNILSSFDGKLAYTEGQWTVRASVWEASSVSFTESDMAGPVAVRGSAPKSERFNAVRGVFVDPARFYEPSEFPHVSNSTYLTRDNSVEIMYDLELPMTNSATMAQRIADRLLEQADNQIIAKVTTNRRGAKCAIGDVVDLTISKLSWAAKTFRVIEWQRNPNGTFDLTLKEDQSASYDDPIVSDYTTGNTASITVPSEVVPPPTNFSASSVPYGIKLSWTNPAFNEFDLIDIYVSETSAWSGATLLASVRADTYTHDLGSGTARYYWLRARRNNGDQSLRTPDSDTSTVTSTSGAGTDSVNITGATLSDQQVVSTAEVGYRLTSGGEEESYEGDPPSPVVWSSISTWLLAGAAGDYECRLTNVSGTNPTSGPAMATWLALSTTREWVWTDSTQDDSAVSFVGTIEIRDNSSPPQTLGSATLTVTIDAQLPTLTLSGGDPSASPAGTPNLASAFAILPSSATAGWRVDSDGKMYRRDGGTYTVFRDGIEWIADPPPAGTYYVRFTSVSGDTPTGGDATGAWHQLNVDREVNWTQSSTGNQDGTVRIEIADDTSPIGTNILATGYYRGRADVEP